MPGFTDRSPDSRIQLKQKLHRRNVGAITDEENAYFWINLYLPLPSPRTGSMSPALFSFRINSPAGVEVIPTVSMMSALAKAV